MMLAAKDYIKTTRLIIEYGCKVNAKNKYSDTALMAACRSRNYDMVKLLIDYKADVNATDDNGDSALTHANRSGDKKIIGLLKSKGAK